MPQSSQQSNRSLVVCENLEDRRLLSASLSAGGTLSVGGGRRADVIVVTKNPDNPNQLRVTVNGEVEDFGGRVKRLYVLAGRGDDSVAIHRRVYTPCTIDGGSGDDSLYGGGGDDSIVGEIGDDSISGGRGRDRCHGGDGVDSMYGGDDDDSIFGESGRDRVFGDSGDDLYDNNREVGDDDDNDRHRRGSGGGGGGGGGNSGPGGGSGSGGSGNSGSSGDSDDDDINDDKGGLRK
ncbi:MAG TPA: hypothetical protein VEA69_02275 [Tepidisphaeraceae bacterium]|nr:hypothetical protein [Tepidisphaeraceae bacterium]